MRCSCLGVGYHSFLSGPRRPVHSKGAAVLLEPSLAQLQSPMAESYSCDQAGIRTAADIEDDVSDDEEPMDEFTSEDALRRSQKVNSVASIASLRMKSHALFRFRIPLCRLVQMPMITPTL